jgi:hypothetical protein
MPILGAQSAGTKGAPTAPTIGTATLSGTSASVTFTAPSFSKLPITSYTVTSSPGGITGTGSSSPITVSGLSYDTAYTFSVTAATSNGASASSAASNSVTPAIPYWLTKTDSPNGLLTPESMNIIGKGGFIYSNGTTYNSGFSQVGFLLKYTSTGSLTWSRDAGVSQFIMGIAVADSGNIYITGRAGTAGHVTKIDSSGTIQWTRALTFSGGTITGRAIAIDSSENVYIVGSGRHSSTIYNAGLIAKYNSSGVIQWQRALYRTNDSCQLRSVTIDTSGNVIVSGEGANGVGSNIAWTVAKYNTNGGLLWQKQGQQGGAGVTTLVCDSSGNVYAGGYTDGNTGGGIRATLFKFDSSGTNQWYKQFNFGGNGPGNARTRGVSIDSSGNICIGGTASINGTPGPRAFIQKYNSSGSVLLERTFSNASNDTYAFRVSDDDSLMTAQNNNVTTYIFKLPNDGSKTGTYSSGGAPTMTYTTGLTMSSVADVTFINGALTDAAGQLTDAAGAFAFTGTSVVTLSTTSI